MNQPLYIILVVDDDATVRKTLSLHLENAGYRVIAAKNGEEALTALENRGADLVLLDMRMPVISGLHVLREIRERFNALNLPVIMLTRSDDAGDMVQAFKYGANDYVLKSGDIAVLEARIETQISLCNMNATLAATKSDLQNRVFHSNVEIELTRSELEREMNNRARAEQALVESESRFKVLYDNTPSMSFIIEEEGEILSVNRYGAFVLGYRRDDLVGDSIFKTYHPDDEEELKAHLGDVMQNQSTLHHWELRRISSKGETIHVWETAKAITDMLGNLSILIVSAELEKPADT